VGTGSCPRCDAPVTAAGDSCPRCGFVLVEGAGGARLPPGRGIAATIAAAALLGGGALLATREGEPPVPAPLAVPRAERLLEHQFTANEGDDTAAVTCPAAVEARTRVRCQVRYALGGRQPILVRLTRSGEFDVRLP
jgi:hypothetical protein